MKNIIGIISLILLVSCGGIPENVTAVDNFELNRYLGKWYEIARFDHSFERGLSNVSANYTLRDDGGVDVLNKGKNESGKWKEANGKAYFVGEQNIGMLEVSFFGPFYSGYNIIALDKVNYSFSMVCGPNRDYLWILARTKTLDKNITDSLVNFAKNLDFETQNFIWVDQSSNE